MSKNVAKRLTFPHTYDIIVAKQDGGCACMPV
jgi:hypothetical protein